MTAAGASLRRRGRRLQLRFLLTNKWRVLAILAVVVAGTAVFALLNPWLTQFALGAGTVCCLLAVREAARPAGADNALQGAEAERWTGHELKRLRRRGWTIHHNLRFEDRDIDHIAVGPGGIYAIDTKYSTKIRRLNGDGITEASTLTDRHHPAPWLTRCAQLAAADLMAVIATDRTLLRDRLHRRVTPVLVLWGPHTHPIGGGARWVGPVLVADGRQADQWLPMLNHTRRLTSDEIERVGRQIRRWSKDHG